MSDVLSKLGDLKAHIEESLSFWKVPGVAVSLVKDGEMVLAEGYGCKDLENKKEVTPNTVMPIGSASKSFTAMACAILVEEGKMAWDKPVTEYIPGFEMFDKVASQSITIRDMLCHRTGLPRHDLMWAGGTGEAFTREELIRRVRFLENNVGFREKFQYQNHMFAAAGHAVEKVSGKTWEAFVKEKIMEPLGMKESNFHVADSQKMPDYGLPYRLNKEKEIVPAQFMELGAPGPAGSINSTVTDMSNWIKLLLNKGTLGDNKIVSEDMLKEMHTPQVHSLLLPWEFPEALFSSYGLGWFMEVYHGHKVIHHGGNVTGFTALVSLLPDQNLGFCILTNMNSSFMTYALQNEIHDRVLGTPKSDWNKRYKDEYDKLMEKMEEGKAEAAKNRKENAPPTHSKEAYAGVYEHAGYGTLTVTENDDPKGFKINFNGKDLKLSHHHYNHYNLVMDNFDTELLSHFNIGNKGEIESIAVPFEPSLGKDIIFTRKPEEAKDEK